MVDHRRLAEPGLEAGDECILAEPRGVFALQGKASGPGDKLVYTVDGLTSGATYEWYAVVKECGAKVTTPTRTFTVQ